MSIPVENSPPLGLMNGPPWPRTEWSPAPSFGALWAERSPRPRNEPRPPPLLVLAVEFLIDRSGDVGHHPRPKHFGFPLDLQPRESEIVDAVFQSEKSIRGEPVEAASSAISTRLSFLTIRVQ